MSDKNYGSTWRNALIVLLVFLSVVILVWLVMVSCAQAEIRKGTVAMDYRNKPTWQDYTDFEYVILSPRANTIRADWAADSLIERGNKIIYWWQPFVCFWQGNPITAWPYEADLWSLIEFHDYPIVRDTLGNYAEISGSDISGCYVLDMRDTLFAKDLAHLVGQHTRNGSGLLIDYGCADISWEPTLQDADVDWRAWGSGYHQFRRGLGNQYPDLPHICQCNRWGAWLPDVCRGLFFEKVGWSLNPYDHVWRVLQAGGSHHVVRYSGSNPQGRRVSAGMALLTDNLFNWMMTKRAPEYFDVHLGDFYGVPYWERAPNVYMRISTHGRVICNFSDEPYKYGKRWINSDDCVIIETRDKATGWWKKWRDTTEAGSP